MSAKATLDVTTNIDESLVTTEPVINGSKNGSTPEKSAEIVNIYIEGAYQCDNNMCANIAVEETAPKLYKWVIVNDGNTKLSTIPSTENELLSQAIYEIEKNIKTIIGNNAKPRYVLNKDPLNNTCNYINVFHSDGRYVDKFKEDPEEYERLIDRWSLLFCPSLAPEKRGESIEAEVIKRLPNKWGVIQVSDFCGVKLKAGQYIPEKRIIAMGSVKQKLRLNKSHGYNTGIDIEEWWLKFFNNYSCDLIIYESSATTPTENFFFIEVKGCAKSNKSKQVELTETQTETCDAFPNQFRLAACRYKLETKGNSHEVAQVTIEYFKITKNDSGLPAIAPCPDIDPRESTKSPTIQTPRTYLITLV